MIRKVIGLTWAEIFITLGIIAVLFTLLVPVSQQMQNAAVAGKMMEDPTLPQTPEALRIVDALAKEVTVEEGRDEHYFAFLHIPTERSEEVTGGMLLAALQKGVEAWTSSQDMDVIFIAYSYKGGTVLLTEFRMQKK